MNERVPLVGPVPGPGTQRTLPPGLLQDLPDGRLAVRPEVSAQEMAFQQWIRCESLAAVRTLYLSSVLLLVI